MKTPYRSFKRFNARHHGTITGYTSGCACEPCRQAMRDYQRERRRRKKATTK